MSVERKEKRGTCVKINANLHTHILYAHTLSRFTFSHDSRFLMHTHICELKSWVKMRGLSSSHQNVLSRLIRVYKVSENITTSKTLTLL